VYHLISDLACQGFSFSDIERIILWKYQEKHTVAMATYWEMNGKSLQQSSGIELPSLPTQFMSNDLIMECFIMMFKTVKQYLWNSMALLVGENLSCDHTFKLPKHIGIMREGKWVPQYDSMFIIQNDRGEVLFWQLTSQTAYSAISDGLNSLKLRSRNQVKTIIIDNCCAWRKKLMGTFGQDVLVKLDLFHAVKRVSTALSKKHIHFYTFLQDGSLVFRAKGECGPKRSKPTPPPETLLANLEFFCKKWGDVSKDGQASILTPAVLNEIEHLKRHMEKGCLSDIPPGFGTNRNENLHRSLNHRLAGHRMGIDLALGLIATFFHTWNAKRSGLGDIAITASYITHALQTGKLHLHSQKNKPIILGLGFQLKEGLLRNNMGQLLSNSHKPSCRQ